MKQRDKYVWDKVDSILNLSEPFDIDLEKVVLNCVLSGEGEKDIFAGLDPGCFYLPKHAAMFEVARELYNSFGSVKSAPLAGLCNRLQTTPEKLKEYFEGVAYLPDALEFYLKILRMLKIRRAVIYESVVMIAKAVDNNYNVDDLVDDCDGFAKRVKSRGVTRIKDPSTVEWFAKDGNPEAEKYLVKRGKEGRPDYCLKDGKFVSEPSMLRLGFQRISIQTGVTK